MQAGPALRHGFTSPNSSSVSPDWASRRPSWHMRPGHRNLREHATEIRFNSSRRCDDHKSPARRGSQIGLNRGSATVTRNVDAPLNDILVAIAFDSILHNLFVIGEAVKSLPPELLESEPETPSNEIATMRDVIGRDRLERGPSASRIPNSNTNQVATFVSAPAPQSVAAQCSTV